jgi:hypothetical protein
MTEQLKKTLASPEIPSPEEVVSYLKYVRWVSECASAEIKELDRYIHEKIKELIQKFQTIAESTIAQEQKARSANETNEKKIEIAGKRFSYPDATSELRRLTDALLADSVVTYERTLIRKKIEELTKALFVHAESSRSFTDNTKESVASIKKSVLDIIVAFQFQDFVKQRLDHIGVVFDSLQTQTEALGERLDFASAPMDDRMIKALLDRFFLSKVRENFVAHLDPDKAKGYAVKIEKDEEDDGIELF